MQIVCFDNKLSIFLTSQIVIKLNFISCKVSFLICDMKDSKFWKKKNLEIETVIS